LVGKSCLSQIAASLVVACAFAAAPAGAVGVTNGGFETGDFTGWTLTGDTAFSGVFSDPGIPQSGTYGASFGTVGDTVTLSQSLATIAGAAYTVDFWLQAELDPFGVATPNSFQLAWNGASVAASTLLNSGAFAYQHFTYNLTATAASTTVAFTFRNDPAFFDLDNVAVTAVTAPVPEPETWALFGLGLAAVAARRRRSSARQ
jgi:hypothetical protein